MTIRTRFAPSPTGYLHLGGARTALYAWLFARYHEGQFVLRVEDTDRERSTKEAVQHILDGMAWLGLDCDEGPFYQSQRTAVYQRYIDQLLEEGKAYRCSCSKERLEKLRETQMAHKEKPRYDGHCRDLNEGGEGDHVIRFKNPQAGSVTFSDLVRGDITVDNSELDDLIIVRTDGSPTYNLTVVVDDFEMKITHVIRGDDHINNTPRQINILMALGAEQPTYAHLPMIHGDDGKKLSKRHGAVSVLAYRDEGFLPEALLNYLVRLGWSHGDQEVFSLKEMVSLFDGGNLSKAPATFNTEKLLWLNQHYIKESNRNEVAEALTKQFEVLGVDVSQGPDLMALVAAQADRAKTLKEMAEKSIYFYQDVGSYDEKAAKKNLKLETVQVLKALIDGFNALPAWEKEPIHEVVLKTAENLDLKLGKVAQPIRVAVTGNTVSPSIDITLALLDKEKTLLRLERAILACK